MSAPLGLDLSSALAAVAAAAAVAPAPTPTDADQTEDPVKTERLARRRTMNAVESRRSARASSEMLSVAAAAVTAAAVAASHGAPSSTSSSASASRRDSTVGSDVTVPITQAELLFLQAEQEIQRQKRAEESLYRRRGVSNTGNELSTGGSIGGGSVAVNPAAPSHSSAGVSPKSADAGPDYGLPLRAYTCIQSLLWRHRLGNYAKDCTRDTLLLAHGLRSSFVVDVFGSPGMWQSMLQELAELDDAFDNLALLTVDTDTCFLLHEPSFRRQLQVDALALAGGASDTSEGLAEATARMGIANSASAFPSSYDGPQFVLVHPSLPTPLLSQGADRQRQRSLLLLVVQELLRQFALPKPAYSPGGPPPSPRWLQLSTQPTPAPADQARVAPVPLHAALIELSLTAMCGYLLGYPCLYGTTLVTAAESPRSSAVGPASATSSAASVDDSSSSNNLGMQPLLRTVLEAELRPEWRVELLPFLQTVVPPPEKRRSRRTITSPDASALMGAAARRSLLCSFTVPVVLESNPIVAAALQRWMDSKRGIEAPLHPHRCCWRLPLLVSQQTVTLPVVAL